MDRFRNKEITIFHPRPQLLVHFPSPTPTSTSLLQYCVRNLSTSSSSSSEAAPRRGFVVFRYVRQVVKTEGIGTLYKGLIPNLIGVAPSKAVYFYTYSTSKRFWNESEIFLPNSAIVHMVSAGSAGFVAASVVNPIWLVKTRLQLHQGHIGIWQMIKRVYKREGFKGFYKGVTASYAGVSETMIQFCIYEYFRGLLLKDTNEMDKRKMDFLNFMVAGGSAKFIACVVAYPHEVVRTRLREESEGTKGFFKTLHLLYKEGYRAMYRGLSVQLMRTVPNTAITMGTYEFVVYMLHHLD
uniref:Mitochondrial carrier protein n=1 Tax=Caenorhabditis japonica TaxID=281687 RepID=A0A8R1HTN7_CAEJA